MGMSSGGDGRDGVIGQRKRFWGLVGRAGGGGGGRARCTYTSSHKLHQCPYCTIYSRRKASYLSSFTHTLSLDTTWLPKEVHHFYIVIVLCFSTDFASLVWFFCFCHRDYWLMWVCLFSFLLVIFSLLLHFAWFLFASSGIFCFSCFLIWTRAVCLFK